MSRWSIDRVGDWYRTICGWAVGPNYIPQTASNAIDMWMAQSWDLATIQKELKWAEQIGINTLRVFLHYIPYEKDCKGFFKRIDQFLTVAHSHGIRTIFVLHDDVWNPDPVNGPTMPEPPRKILSNWVQCPGRKGLENIEMQDKILKSYVTDVLTKFSNDKRVLFWDLYNEPGNHNSLPFGEQELDNKEVFSLAYLKKVFEWARQVDPSQPVSASLWVLDADFANLIMEDIQVMSGIQNFLRNECDLLTFHCYEPLEGFQQYVNDLKVHGRPLICTEYMARTLESTIPDILPWAKQHNIGMIHWGFVSGRCNNIYPWDSWALKYDEEPELWFHDILHSDGRPYIQEEIDVYKALTGKKSKL